ncbi:hypothetical protein LOTGIDRAFT_162204 [Lottia gigantea]|uniref:Uncharacterized protein n=1 Tax=Lottia gigantea TaxID=225164 RepID=V4ACA0_LOTGI|nr:hypothetical protein LOTGIDRAFT_162204 [Lottia gigantea]ESO92730.1 hypothetical protein LOTGIDRAFT_162204 [Lottia gigantea]
MHCIHFRTRHVSTQGNLNALCLASKPIFCPTFIVMKGDLHAIIRSKFVVSRLGRERLNMMDEATHVDYSLSDIRNLIDNHQGMINKLDENIYCMSPLMTEVYKGNFEAVSLLLQYEYIDINIRNKYGHSAYFYCLNPRENVSEQSKLKCLKLLLKAGVQNLYCVQEGHNFTPLMIAAKSCDDVCLNEIIKTGYSNNAKVLNDFDLDSEDEVLLENNYYEEYFYDSHYDIGDDDDIDDDVTLIDDYTSMDIKKRNVDFYTYCHVYKKIWKASNDFWDFGNRKTAFQLCLKARDIPVEKQLACLQLLVEAGASYVTHLNGYQLRPITIAIGRYSAVDPCVIKYLISIGCYLDHQRDFERAVCYMHLEIAQLLIKEGSDPHLLSKNNQNILHILFMWDNLSFFEHDEVYEKMKKMLWFLVQELKIDINAVDDCAVSIFSLVFLNFVKGISFPFLYLMSENIN